MGCFVHAMHIPGNPDSKHWPCEPFLPYTRSAHIIPAGKVSVHCSVSSLTFKNAVDFIWKPLMGCFVHSMHIPGNPDSKHWASNSLSIVLLTTSALWHILDEQAGKKFIQGKNLTEAQILLTQKKVEISFVFRPWGEHIFSQGAKLTNLCHPLYTRAAHICYTPLLLTLTGLNTRRSKINECIGFTAVRPLEYQV